MAYIQSQGHRFFWPQICIILLSDARIHIVAFISWNLAALTPNSHLQGAIGMIYWKWESSICNSQEMTRHLKFITEPYNSKCDDWKINWKNDHSLRDCQCFKFRMKGTDILVSISHCTLNKNQKLKFLIASAAIYRLVCWILWLLRTKAYKYLAKATRVHCAHFLPKSVLLSLFLSAWNEVKSVRCRYTSTIKCS